MRINLSKFLQLKFNVFIYRSLGWGIAYLYIIILGKLYLFFSIKEKKKIVLAVEAVFSNHKKHPEIKSITGDIYKGILYHYYEKLFNAFSSAEELKSFMRKNMEDEGLAAIEEGLSMGKGVLLVTSHFGGVEFAPGYLAAKHFPVTIIVRFSSRSLRDISIEKASKFSSRIIDADSTPNILKAIHDNLKENRVVITQCDEIDEWKSSRENIDFMGNQIKLDRTINILARRLDTYTAFAVMHRVKEGKYRFIVNSLNDILAKLKSPENRSTGALALKFLEHYIYKFPEEWYQWKKYYGIIDFPSPRNVPHKALPAAILRPALAEGQ